MKIKNLVICAMVFCMVFVSGNLEVYAETQVKTQSQQEYLKNKYNISVIERVAMSNDNKTAAYNAIDYSLAKLPTELIDELFFDKEENGIYTKIELYPIYGTDENGNQMQAQYYQEKSMYGDKTLNVIALYTWYLSNEGRDNENAMIILHEVGHIMTENLENYTKLENDWIELTKDSQGKSRYVKSDFSKITFDETAFITIYSYYDAYEDFSETFAYMFAYPEELNEKLEKYPNSILEQKVIYVEKMLKENYTSLEDNNILQDLGINVTY